MLLPTPGSPPISTSAPRTMPPPSTRSNSSKPVGRYASVSSGRAIMGCASRGLISVCPPPRLGDCCTTPTASSCSVFHSPHSGQRPTQRGVICPQLAHTYCTRTFAIASKLYPTEWMLVYAGSHSHSPDTTSQLQGISKTVSDAFSLSGANPDPCAGNYVRAIGLRHSSSAMLQCGTLLEYEPRSHGAYQPYCDNH